MQPVTVTGSVPYIAVKRLGEFPNFTVYACRATGYDSELLLKISSSVTGNGTLDREAFLLRELAVEMQRADDGYRKETNHKSGLGFNRCFPTLVDSFTVAEQGGRRVNIISIYGARQVTDLTPLEQWRTREKRHLDPKSSAWIMGRLFKIFTLTHPFGLAVGQVTGGNILINAEEHHVCFFDWSQARHYGGSLPENVAKEEISLAATAVFLALGGDLVTGKLPESEQLQDDRYARFLKRCIDKQVADAFRAGKEFYELLDELWEKSFHPFTTYHLT